MPSFTFVVLSFFSRGKEHTRDMLLPRERHTNIFSPDFTFCFRTLASFPESERQRVSFERSGFPHSSLFYKCTYCFGQATFSLTFALLLYKFKEIEGNQLHTDKHTFLQVRRFPFIARTGSLNCGPFNVPFINMIPSGFQSAPK